MELSNLKLPDFVRLAGIIFEKAKDTLGQEARRSGLFVEEAISANSGNTREYTEMDQELYASNKGEDAQAKRAKVQQGYKKILYSKRIAKDIGISYEARTMNKYPEVIRRLTNLAGLAVNRMDLDLTHRITFGTATSYTDMDGETVDTSVGDTLAPFSTVHTLKASSATYRNRLAGNPALSKGALEGMETLVVEETLNQFGEKVTMKFDTIFTTDDPNTVNLARELLQSTASIDSGANSGVKNVYLAKYTHFILPLLATDAFGAVDSTKKRYWGLASKMNSQAHLGIWEEPRLKVPANLNAGEDFSTDGWNFGVRAGYGICMTNAAWLKFSSGDGTP